LLFYCFLEYVLNILGTAHLPEIQYDNVRQMRSDIPFVPYFVWYMKTKGFQTFPQGNPVAKLQGIDVIQIFQRW
ncbi:MAG: hypothetical protein AAB874_02995, partial [Patescibacteria group bacterium]